MTEEKDPMMDEAPQQEEMMAKPEMMNEEAGNVNNQ